MEDVVKGAALLAGAAVAAWIGLKIAWWLLLALWWLIGGVWWLVCLPFSGEFWRGLFELSCCCAEGLVAGVCLVVMLIVFAKAFGHMTNWM